jgi:thiamine biosynthesis protein ThiI
MDKLSIIRIAEEIDTYETSILPYEDCCTVFTPRHPVTKPKIDKVEREEKRLDLETLIEEAVQNTEILFLKD